ncbi:GNAT family N-acetyltransferase [Planococcus salinus]|uniref:Lipid II:glycine glycyltransferase n=1 Tax=Planococcus salinus TaxID=1848460 RepID=A0A3M8P786_9BACL|nr:GNAT family N-acetyltransferase [Planococcus salinus]RNF39535.1 GNAT family N-acetyltransferase [Planococcus salinus]
MANFPDIYFLPEWGKYFEKKEVEGELRIVELENEWGHVFYQFIVRPIPLISGPTLYYDTITPFGFSGPIILKCEKGRNEELAVLFNQKFQEYCEAHHIVTEYVRFNPWLKNLNDFKGFYSLRNNGITQYIDLTVNDYFAEEFSPKSRTQVRKARKSGVEIELDFTGAHTKEFCRLYELMAIKNNVENEYYLFTEEFIRDSFKLLEGKQFILFAKYQGNYISASLILHHGDYVHYHLTANDPEYFHLAANSLIIDEACRWGVEHGKKQLHLGGTSGDEQLFRFKKKFTKTAPLDLLMGKKIRNEEVYNMLVDFKKSNGGIQNMDYFPLYRG